MSRFARKVNRNQQRKTRQKVRDAIEQADQVLENVEDASEDEVEDDQKKLPSGKVTTSPVKGEFSTFPLLGWVAVRAKEKTPLVMLLLALMKDDKMRGVFQMELPVYEDTELATLAFLERYGWKGQTWKPGDEGWPTGDVVNEDQLATLISTTGLSTSLIFPPTAEGSNLTQVIEVMRARGPFLMPPLPEPTDDPDPERLEYLRHLCTNPKVFAET